MTEELKILYTKRTQMMAEFQELRKKLIELEVEIYGHEQEQYRWLINELNRERQQRLDSFFTQFQFKSREEA